MLLVLLTALYYHRDSRVNRKRACQAVNRFAYTHTLENN